MLRVLGVHGLGDHRQTNWADSWSAAIASRLDREQRDAFEFIPFRYDHLFERVRITPQDACRAFRKLVRSGMGHRRRIEVVQESTRWLRWYAGYVVAWVQDAEFRREVGCALRDALTTAQPDVVAAHSLGSLISYDVLRGLDSTDTSQRLDRLIYVTLGSQLGNPFVAGNLAGGGVRPLAVRRWVHLYNPHDDAFTAPLTFVNADNFEQLSTRFNVHGWADHHAVAYLAHPEAGRRLWNRIAEWMPDPAGAGSRSTPAARSEA
jgi:hypothetical protein